MSPQSDSECRGILRDHKLPIRDIRMIMKESEPRGRYYLPVLMLRPSFKCFIFDMESIKFVCFQDKCMIFNIDDDAAQTFIGGLQKKFESSKKNTDGQSTQTNDDEVDNENSLDFEHVILEYALENVAQKFKKHMQVIGPALDFFLKQIELDPEPNRLRKILTVKKYLTTFLQKVQHVKTVLQNIYKRDDEMLSLYLSQLRKKEDHKEMELLLYTYTVLLEAIVSDLKISIGMIDTTDQFVSAHLDSIRYGIIKMNLFMEMGCLVFAFGTFATGLLGMNLFNSLEESPYAFFTVAITLGVTMMIGFALLVRTYGMVLVNKNGHNCFKDLNDTFHYVDDLEYQVPIKRDEKIRFKKAQANGCFNKPVEYFEFYDCLNVLPK